MVIFTILVILHGKSILQVVTGLFLIAIVFLLFATVISFVALEFKQGLMIMFYLILFLNATFYFVYFIPIGIEGKKLSLPPATTAIILLNIIIFIITRPQDSALFNWFLLRNGQIHTYNIITSIFHHLNIWHLGFNMLYLWVFGAYLEDRIGWKKFTYFYLLTGSIACIGQILTVVVYNYDHWRYYAQLGASGAISGIMGLFLMRCNYARVRFFPNPFIIHLVKLPTFNAYYFLIITLFGEAAMSVLVLSNTIYSCVGFGAHLSGLIAGILLGREKGLKENALKERLLAEADDIIKSREVGGNAEEKLKQLLDLDPNHESALVKYSRILSDREITGEDGRRLPDPLGKVNYEKAIKLYFKSDWKYAALLFAEYFRKYLEVFSDRRLYFELCRSLARKGDFQTADMALQELISKSKTKDSLVEEGYIMRARILEDNLGFKEAALQAYDDLLKNFPDTQYKSFALARLKKAGVEVSL